MEWHICEDCGGAGGWFEKEYAPRDFEANPLTPMESVIRDIYGPIILDQLNAESRFL